MSPRSDDHRNPLRLLMHVPVPWVFVLAYLVGVCLEWALRSGARPYRDGLAVAAAVVFLAGAVIAGWSLVIFHRKGTTTTPGEASVQLVTWGPYRMSRNPMYVGLTLAYLGEAGLLQQAWPLVMLPLTLAYVNWIVIPVEEGTLLDTFGADYERYRASVRRWV